MHMLMNGLLNAFINPQIFCTESSLITSKMCPSLQTCIQCVLVRYMQALSVIQSADSLHYTILQLKSWTQCLSLCQQAIGSERTTWQTISVPELHHSQQVTATTLSGFVPFNALLSKPNLSSEPSLHHLTNPSIWAYVISQSHWSILTGHCH